MSSNEGSSGSTPRSEAQENASFVISLWEGYMGDVFAMYKDALDEGDAAKLMGFQKSIRHKVREIRANGEADPAAAAAAFDRLSALAAAHEAKGATGLVDVWNSILSETLPKAEGAS